MENPLSLESYKKGQQKDWREIDGIFQTTFLSMKKSLWISSAMAVLCFFVHPLAFAIFATAVFLQGFILYTIHKQRTIISKYLQRIDQVRETPASEGILTVLKNHDLELHAMGAYLDKKLAESRPINLSMAYGAGVLVGIGAYFLCSVYHRPRSPAMLPPAPLIERGGR
ncbi:MAG: hypothetical protein AB7G80_09680 [Dongiaceae bacterium]